MEQNGTEQNKMEWNGTEKNGPGSTEQSFLVTETKVGPISVYT